jgi:hypothetical protein
MAEMAETENDIPHGAPHRTGRGGAFAINGVAGDDS